LHFELERPLTNPKKARALGPLSPEGLRAIVRKQVKSTTASKYVGVYWNKIEKYWYALIYIDKRYVSLGIYDDEKEAAEAVDSAARYLKRTPQNFPEKKLPARSPEDLRIARRVLRGTSKYFGLTHRDDGSGRPWHFQIKLVKGRPATVVGGYK